MPWWRVFSDGCVQGGVTPADHRTRKFFEPPMLEAVLEPLCIVIVTQGIACAGANAQKLSTEVTRLVRQGDMCT
jgi:hypothetical protein